MLDKGSAKKGIYKDLSTSKKLSIGYGTLLFFTIVISVVAFIFLFSLKSILKNMYEGPNVSTVQTMGIRRDLNALCKDIRSAILTKDSVKFSSDMQESIQSVNDRIDVLYGSFEKSSLIDELNTAMEDLIVKYEKVLSLIKSNSWEEAEVVLFSEFDQAFEVVAAKSMALFDQAESEAKDFYVDADKYTVTASTVIIIVLVVAILLSIIIILISTRAIVMPVREVLKAAEEMAEGNLKTSVKYSSNDEIGELAKAFNKTIDSLNLYINEIYMGLTEIGKGNLCVEPTVEFKGDFIKFEQAIRIILESLNVSMSNIRRATDQVSAGAEQLSLGAQELAEGATEQAHAVDNLNHTMNVVGEKVMLNSKNANEASGKAQSIGIEIDRSHSQMTEMTKSMMLIADTAKQIETIIGTIESIASQTNMLSLNAAIEAACAGEAGRGFAVVADEIRNLATESAEAAKNTRKLINASVNAVGAGTEIAQITAVSLEHVVRRVGEIIDDINMIAVHIKEEEGLAMDIVKGLSLIEDVVQRNAAASEESAATSEELFAQVQSVQGKVQNYKLREL